MGNDVLAIDQTVYGTHDSNDRGHVDIWNAVIKVAVQDALCFLPTEYHNSYNARAWFQNNSSDFKLVCDLALKDATYVRSHMLKHLAANEDKIQEQHTAWKKEQEKRADRIKEARKKSADNKKQRKLQAAKAKRELELKQKQQERKNKRHLYYQAYQALHKEKIAARKKIYWHKNKDIFNERAKLRRQAKKRLKENTSVNQVD